jgi:hypothetical protein
MNEAPLGGAGAADEALGRRIVTFFETGSLAVVNELHDSGEWTDLEMALDSTKTPNGKTRHFTAMVCAAFDKQLEMMRWLIEKGAKVNESREWYYSPSNHAAAVGFIEGLELLKEKGCDLSKADSTGATPVHDAAAYGQLPAIRFLLSYGVPMDVKDKSGRTPADCATRLGHTECAAFLKLLEIGVPVDHRVADLIRIADVISLRRLHSEKVWTDLETVVDSMKGRDGKTRHITAMAVAAGHEQLEVMMIEKGVKVDEELLASLRAWSCSRRRAAIFQRQTAMLTHLFTMQPRVATWPPSASSTAMSVLWTAQPIQASL